MNDVQRNLDCRFNDIELDKLIAARHKHLPDDDEFAKNRLVADTNMPILIPTIIRIEYTNRYWHP